MSAEERAREGRFSRVPIPGGNSRRVARAISSRPRSTRSASTMASRSSMPAEFLNLVREKMKLLKMDPSFMNRAVNEGFSGRREKTKRNLSDGGRGSELGLMDETDSGLDIDALKIVAEGATHCAGRTMRSWS